MKVSKAITVGRPPSEVYAFWRDQTPVHRYMRPLLDRIQNGEIDPSVVITHRLPLADAAHRVQDLPAQGRPVWKGGPEGVEVVGTAAAMDGSAP